MFKRFLLNTNYLTLYLFNIFLLTKKKKFVKYFFNWLCSDVYMNEQQSEQLIFRGSFGEWALQHFFLKKNMPIRHCILTFKLHPLQ